MRYEFSALPWEMLGLRPVMVTLTYPGEWEGWCPDGATLTRHRQALLMRWTRRYGAPVGVWVVEFQKRGAPHYHMYLGLPEQVSGDEYEVLRRRTLRRKVQELDLGKFEARSRVQPVKGEFSWWLRTAWAEIVTGNTDKAHHVKGVDIAVAFWSEKEAMERSRAQVAEYFWLESGKWGQKQAPHWFGVKKWYGRWGAPQGFGPQVTHGELPWDEYVEVRRVQRVWLRSKEASLRQRNMGGRAWKSSRGMDGATVYGLVNGRDVGLRLLQWAREAAAEKGRPEAAVAAEASPLAAPGQDDELAWKALNDKTTERARRRQALRSASRAAKRQAREEAARDAWVTELPPPPPPQPTRPNPGRPSERGKPPLVPRPRPSPH
jgi:hypothetical protein